MHRYDRGAVSILSRLIFIISSVQGVLVNAQDPTVTLRQGTLKGIKIYTDDARMSVIAYLGIPYATPPIGNLRFAPPQRHQGWERVFFAGSFGPACPQPHETLVPNVAAVSQQDENCLFLNIWAPEISLNYRNTPVVVFFEGEGFVSGTPSRFPAQDLAAEGLVVVSVNYRMNVFGFFSLEDAEARGNLGLLDQYLALLWVRENIPYFGGDGKSITLMGHSAGAASAVYHMVSPKTAGLFHKVIIMSGSVTSPWMKTRSVSQASRSIARSLGCLTVNETRPILKCMRDKSTSELMRAFENQYKDGNWTELVLPVVDTFLPDIEQYLPRDPITALEEGMYHKVPVLTGITSHEGAISIARWSDLISQGFANLRQLFVNSIIPSVMNMYGFASHMSSVPEIRTLLEWQYVDNVPSGDAHALLSKILDFFTDSQYRAPYELQLKLLTKHDSENIGATYAYQFEQTSPDLYSKLVNITGMFQGCGHGQELIYLFGPALMQQVTGRRFTPNEDRLSVIVRRLWAEFMRVGHPAANSYGYGIPWKRYNHDLDNYVVIKSDPNLPPQQPILRQPSTSVVNDVAARYRISLWNELLPKMHNLSVILEQINMLNQIRTEMQLAEQPYRSVMFTLIGFVFLLLVLLVICVVLLKRKSEDRERDLF
ncbi:hypothetical protein M8J77_015027 [Diaphorina citri]|nr:hypothetical protein M8J77_015027 [Diaphorina citri]